MTSLRLPDIKYSMIAYIGFLLLWGSFQVGNLIYLWKGLLMGALYIVYDLSWTYLRDRVSYLPLSSVISGFILAIVGPANPSLIILFSLPLAAVISKQLIKIGERRHIFNPAGFALIVFSLGGYPVVSWWVPALTSGGIWLGLIILAGLAIIYRQSRWETAISFLASYATLLAILFIFQGRELSTILPLLKTQILDGTTLFFTSVMLIEPITSNFPGKRNKIIYGVLVALCAVLFTAFAQYFVELDPLLSALLVGNFVMSIITLLI